MRKFSVYCLCFFVSASHSFSQQLQLTNYSSREGVPVYGTNSILQDGNGWMWFTSGYDVIRYDGSRFISYLPTSKTKMDYCFRVLEVDKEIWVVASPYLLKVSGDSMEKVDAEKNTPGILHAIGHRGKTYFLCEDGLYTLSKGYLTPIIKDAEITITHGEFLIPYNDSLMFSFQFNKRLVIFNLNRLSIHTVDLPVTDIKRESGRFYLFVKGTGIVALNEISLTGNTINLLSEKIVLITDPEYERFAIDGRGSFWTYKLHQQLITLTPGKPVRVFNESNGLPSLWIHQLFVDREKNLWISSYSGLCKIQDANVDRYTINESLYSNVPVFLTKNIKSGQVIVGTEKGVSVFEDGRMKKISQNNRPFNCRSLICAGNNYYYYRDSFLFSAKLDANRLIPVHERKLARIEGVGIDLTSDARNNVYLATTTGVFVYDGRELTRILPDKTYFHNVYIDSGGRLWTGKFSGELTCYRVEHGPGSVRLTRALQVDSISPNIPRLHLIRALAEDGNGNIYVGTRYNGLFVLKMKEDKLLDVKHFGEENGISSNSVWSLSVDTAGACWIGTAKGLNLLKNRDGQWLVSDEGKKRQLKQATLVLTGDDNTVWIANHPGVVRIKNETRYSAGLFSTYVTSVMIAGKRLRSSLDNLKQFSYRNNNVAIEFSANTFLNEEDVLYSWRLHDKDEWSAPVPLHSVNYSALQPGKYNFRVRAIRSDGYWSANAAGFGFEILPPFWQQSWFIALAILLPLGGMYMLYRYRVQQLKKLYEYAQSYCPRSA